MLDYQSLIEHGFDIIDKRGNKKPFVLNVVQRAYLESLSTMYPDLEGVRDNDLKARQQGFSALIDAIFLVDFLKRPNIGAQIISHKIKETETLINRVNFYLDSFLEKRNVQRSAILTTDRMDYLENKLNGSYIFIGTAGAKTLGRGGTLQNIHWSEVGFYPNTEILSAEKLVVAAEQQVAMGVGKIFRESTGNMSGDYFSNECDRSRKGESNFRFYFSPWYKNPEYALENTSGFTPTEAERNMMEKYQLSASQILWYRLKSTEFKTRALFLREYPTTPEEAFLAGGKSFFDPDVLKYYMDRTKSPIREGSLAQDGSWA